jgi:organic radical activating enzyme
MKDKIVYPIVEHFYTLQGEGCYSGQAAYFIRLGGCDVGCTWCDTKESWDATAHQKFDIETILNWVIDANAEMVVITGGEPLMHHLTPLTNAFVENEIGVNMETSGSHNFSGAFDWVCLSPKKFKKPLPEVYKKADELKIVVFNKSDFEFAEQEAKKVGEDCLLYLQPEWDKRATILPEIIHYIKENPQWQLSLQIHKMIQIP